MGEYYLKDIPIEESRKYLHNLKEEGISVKGETELSAYMASLINIELPLGTPLWRAYFVEDFSDTESCIVIKFHHSFGDGMAILITNCSLMDTFKPSVHLPKMKKFSWMEKLVIFLSLPVYLPYVLNKPLFRKNERNLIHKEKLSGTRVGFISKDFST